MITEERCPELKAVRAGDETYYWCNLSDHLCVVEYGDENDCEDWNDIKKEWEDES